MRFAPALLLLAASFGPLPGFRGYEARAAWQTADPDSALTDATARESQPALHKEHSRGRDAGWKLHRGAGLPARLTLGIPAARGATIVAASPSSPPLSIGSHRSRAPPLA